MLIIFLRQVIWILLVWLPVSFFQPVLGTPLKDSVLQAIKGLSENNSNGNTRFEYLYKYAGESVADTRAVLKVMEETGDSSDFYFAARYYLWKAHSFWLQSLPSENDSVKMFCALALKHAYSTGDQKLIAMVSWHFGQMMDNYQETALAVMYCLNAADINEKAGVEFTGEQYWKLGHVLYRVREYEKTIHYCKIASQRMRQNLYMVTCLNTIALCYQKLGYFDSAMTYYDSALAFTKNLGADLHHIEEWKGIIAGNKAQIYFLRGEYQKALPLFEFNCQQSKIAGSYDDVANALQWTAKTNLVLGNQKAALNQLREAFYFLNKRPFHKYYENLYNTAADVYRVAGMADSAFYFTRKYQQLHDSIEADVVSSRLEIARTRLENEKYYYDIQRVAQQKQAEANRRNLLIGVIILLAVFSIIYINYLRSKSEHRQQIAAEKNRHAELEIAATKAQLESFTRSLVEKNTLIDQLHQKLEQNDFTAAQQETLSQLLQSRIITEEEWTTFKVFFEKLHPGFFHRLKENYSGITGAEQRMAALIKLRLSTRETASMLGISVESAQKTRQRLKQRLNLSNEVKIEEYVASF
jgi:tetratricopeptide (TPR) repeat protein/DNA-binding CsgD family transcriptional regulator